MEEYRLAMLAFSVVCLILGTGILISVWSDRPRRKALMDHNHPWTVSCHPRCPLYYGRHLTHDEDGRLLGGFRPPTETVYDAEGLARELRLTVAERMAVGLDLPLNLIEDQSHIIRGEN